MTFQYRAGPTPLATTASTVASGPCTVTNIIVTNTSGSARTFTLSIGADSSSTEIFSNVTVPSGGGGLTLPGPYTLGSGEVMQAFASGAGVNLTMSGSTPNLIGPADFTVGTTPLATIRGFGASDRNFGQNSAVMTSAQADLLFDPTAGIGLSFLRVSMEPDGTPTSSFTDCSLAAARGAQIWMAPWSPPAIWKDNGSTINGGHLFPANYGDWATQLANFQGLLHTATGLNLYGVSVQNEPDFSAPYDSCLYTPTEMVNFIKVLGPKLAALTPVPILIAPEPSNWGNLQQYVTPIEADSTAFGFIGSFATHDYTYSTSVVNTNGKELWETEVSTFDAIDKSISNGLMVAGWIHRAFTQGNVTAWHYWRLWQPDSDNSNESLILDTQPWPKRLYCVGNWSKFVRPNYQRFDVTGTVSGISVTAFTGSGKTVIVCINNNGSPTTCVFAVPAGAVATPWRTSATEDLVSLPTIGLQTGRFQATLAANSVTSFVVQ